MKFGRTRKAVRVALHENALAAAMPANRKIVRGIVQIATTPAKKWVRCVCQATRFKNTHTQTHKHTQDRGVSTEGFRHVITESRSSERVTRISRVARRVLCVCAQREGCG